MNNGGPAFPIPGDDNYNRVKGMSLLDWFAGQALAGLCAQPISRYLKPELSWDEVGKAYINLAWEFAEAMLKERQKRLDAAKEGG